MAIKLSQRDALPSGLPREPACAKVLSWRVALSLIANVSISLWIVIGKAVLLLAL